MTAQDFLCKAVERRARLRQGPRKVDVCAKSWIGTSVFLMEDRKRCVWAGADPLMIDYHDREWGTPVHDDSKHFEFLVLEAAQAGLSWSIVLKKREGYRRAFSQFDPEKVARYTERRVQKLLLNPAIIRNRLKIESAIRNARAFLAVQDEFGSFDAYCWRF